MSTEPHLYAALADLSRRGLQRWVAESLIHDSNARKSEYLELRSQLSTVEQKLDTLIQQGAQIMTGQQSEADAITALERDVADLTTAVSTFATNQQATIDAAIAAANAGDVTKLQELHTAMRADLTTLQGAFAPASPTAGDSASGSASAPAS